MPHLLRVWRGSVGYYCKYESNRYVVTASSNEINVVFVFSASNCVFNRIQNRSITKMLCAGSFDF